MLAILLAISLDLLLTEMLARLSSFYIISKKVSYVVSYIVVDIVNQNGSYRVSYLFSHIAN